MSLRFANASRCNTPSIRHVCQGLHNLLHNTDYLAQRQDDLLVEGNFLFGQNTSRPKIPVISLFVSAKDEFVDISAGINVFVGLRGITIPMAKTSVDARVYVR